MGGSIAVNHLRNSFLYQRITYNQKRIWNHFWVLWDLNPGWLGEKRERNHCAMTPPSPSSKLIETEALSNRGLIWMKQHRCITENNRWFSFNEFHRVWQAFKLNLLASNFKLKRTFSLSPVEHRLFFCNWTKITAGIPGPPKKLRQNNTWIIMAKLFDWELIVRPKTKWIFHRGFLKPRARTCGLVSVVATSANFLDSNFFGGPGICGHKGPGFPEGSDPLLGH